MRACVQRVSSASVDVAGETVGKIKAGLVVLLGVAVDDTEEDAKYLANKLVHLRVHSDEQDKMNLSLLDIKGAMLVISQFTLLGDCRKGRRPSFVGAAPPVKANALYESLVSDVRAQGIHVETGQFQASMQVALVNDGPVTLLLDSRSV